MLYLDEEEKRTQKWERYAVRILASIRRIFSEHPERVREEDLYVKYEEKVNKKKTLADRTKEAYAMAKAAFGFDFSKKKKAKDK